MKELFLSFNFIFAGFLLGAGAMGFRYESKIESLEHKINSHKCIYTDTIYISEPITPEHDCYGTNKNYHKGKK